MDHIKIAHKYTTQIMTKIPIKKIKKDPMVIDPNKYKNSTKKYRIPLTSYKNLA
jgi:hypothetical protein